MLENNDLAIKIKELKGTDSYREMSAKTHGHISHSYFNTLINGDTRTKQPIKPTPEKLKLIADAYPLKTNYHELMTLAGYDKADKVTEGSDTNRRFEEELLLAFDGKPIPEEDKKKILEYVEFLKLKHRSDNE